jgi:hypothetical protein
MGQIYKLKPLVIAREMSEVVHNYLYLHPYDVRLAVPGLVLTFVFIMREVGQWTDKSRIIIRRATSTTAGLFAGSFFWGMLFAPPIQWLLEWQTEPSASKSIVAISLVGASLTTLFAIVVELVWDEKSIAEPLGEPL